MYIEIEFNLIYQVERLAKRTGRSVTDLVNEAVAQYVERNTDEDAPAQPAADDAT
jgi:hypothetical protein